MIPPRRIGKRVPSIDKRPNDLKIRLVLHLTLAAIPLRDITRLDQLLLLREAHAFPPLDPSCLLWLVLR